MVTSGLIITIAARIDLAKDASRILIRLLQILPINMAFAAYAYVMENVILFFFPGGAFSHILKPPRGVFVLTAQPQRGAFAAFPKKNDKYPINARGDGHVFN